MKYTFKSNMLYLASTIKATYSGRIIEDETEYIRYQYQLKDEVADEYNRVSGFKANAFDMIIEVNKNTEEINCADLILIDTSNQAHYFGYCINVKGEIQVFYISPKYDELVYLDEEIYIKPFMYIIDLVLSIVEKDLIMKNNYDKCKNTIKYEFDFKKAYYYAKNATEEQLSRRALVYNAYIQYTYNDGRPSVGHDIILTIIGAMFGPLNLLRENDKKELHDYLEYIDRGINTNWYDLTLEWFKNKTKESFNIEYFMEIVNILNFKSNMVYKLLCKKSDIPIYKLIPTNISDQFDGNMHIYYNDDMYDVKNNNSNKKVIKTSNNFTNNTYYDEDQENPFGEYKPWK